MRRTASSWRRATTGSARRCSRRPDGACGSPTCTARSSSTRSGSPRSPDSGWTSERERARADLPGLPRREKAATDPAARRLDTAGLVPRWKPQRLATRYGAAALFERQGQVGDPAAGRSSPPSRRTHWRRLGGACTLDGLAGHRIRTCLKRALSDEGVAGMRRHAVRLGRAAPGQTCKRSGRGSREARRTIPSAHVRQQVGVFARGNGTTRGREAAGEAGGSAAARSRVILTAAVRSVNGRTLRRRAEGALPPGGRAQSPELLVGGLFRMAAALHQDGAILSLLDSATVPQDGKIAPWQYATMNALLDRLAENGADAGERPAR